jgi:hypothetical protein
MSSKLTLSIDKKIIERAKEFARRTDRSLSNIIESYLQKITDQQLDEVDHDLEQLIGVIKLPEDFDEKKAIRKVLSKKHHQ